MFDLPRAAEISQSGPNSRHVGGKRKAIWLFCEGRLKPDQLLFTISGKVPGGTERKTHKMMNLDLAAALSK
jgi:hypothetical protein